ncbi:MAG: SPOR domain-containing protein [Tannerellaceae bacterium]|jgi:hypothetical protein|nr:SPOR domain-containing protein [Tannerellaceae bacterium]
MKPLFFILLLFPCLLFAQNEQVKTIFDSLQEPGAGKGNVVVRQSDAIRQLVGARKHGANVEETDGDTFLVLEGFRAQVFSGNNQRLSKDEAFDKEKQIKEQFPELTTYVTYTAPFWRLRVGDYRTHEEAYHVLRQLSEAFPAFAKEMYIVKEKIRMPLH